MANRVLKSRSQRGFTLIELLVVVIIIGILAAIALPNFIGAQDKAREASVKANMRTCQIAAESYATDAGGQYPPTGGTPFFINYFPGGGSALNSSAAGTAAFPINPFKNATENLGSGSVTVVSQTRSNPPASLGSAGTVYYNGIADASNNETSYAVQGGNKTGTALAGSALNAGAQTTLVLSNQ